MNDFEEGMARFGARGMRLSSLESGATCWGKHEYVE